MDSELLPFMAFFDFEEEPKVTWCQTKLMRWMFYLIETSVNILCEWLSGLPSPHCSLSLVALGLGLLSVKFCVMSFERTFFSTDSMCYVCPTRTLGLWCQDSLDFFLCFWLFYCWLLLVELWVTITETMTFLRVLSCTPFFSGQSSCGLFHYSLSSGYGQINL